MSINFMSPKDFEESRTMHSKSHNVEIIMGNEIDDIIKKFLNLFCKDIKKYQKKKKRK